MLNYPIAVLATKQLAMLAQFNFVQHGNWYNVCAAKISRHSLPFHHELFNETHCQIIYKADKTLLLVGLHRSRIKLDLAPVGSKNRFIRCDELNRPERLGVGR